MKNVEEEKERDAKIEVQEGKKAKVVVEPNLLKDAPCLVRRREQFGTLEDPAEEEPAKEKTNEKKPKKGREGSKSKRKTETEAKDGEDEDQRKMATEKKPKRRRAKVDEEEKDEKKTDKEKKGSKRAEQKQSKEAEAHKDETTAEKPKRRKTVPKKKDDENASDAEKQTENAEKTEETTEKKEKSFARRPPPSSQRSKARWAAIRDAFVEVIKPKVQHHSKLQVWGENSFGKCFSGVPRLYLFRSSTKNYLNHPINTCLKQLEKNLIGGK